MGKFLSVTIPKAIKRAHKIDKLEITTDSLRPIWKAIQNIKLNLKQVLICCLEERGEVFGYEKLVRDRWIH